MTTALSISELTLPTAAPGGVDPLPPLDPPVSAVVVRDGVPASIAERTRSGAPSSLVPYLMQDGYTRELSPQPMRVAVLENARLRATIALDVGGRLWSLYDKVDERELLYVNPVLQPANLALRNAWCSGGVEWNIGTRGHSPTTMSTLHAARVDGPGGESSLRLWEYERIRGVVFQVDLWLPDEAPALLATIRIRNVNDSPVPMYWWTNAAVPATARTRVIVPATRAFRTEYPDAVRVANVPDDGDGDLTYPSNSELAADWFFDIDDDQPPWIASVGDDGLGIAHVSTELLRGRKLFVWGTGAGGSRWQEWLSHGRGGDYAEIQAGLAPTQFEHLTMPARADWVWTEAFVPVAVDPKQSHGRSWDAAVDSVGETLSDVLGSLPGWHAEAESTRDAPPDELIGYGSGWGALERDRRAASGETWFDDRATPFGDAGADAEVAPWVALLEEGELPPLDPAEDPPSYVTGGNWDERLADADKSWLTAYHRGVIAHGAGDLAAARERYETSLALAPSAWALRGLAEVARMEHRAEDAAALAVDAARMAPDERHLAAEAVSRLLDIDRAVDALALVAATPERVRSHPRIKLLEGFAAVATGDPGRARAILDAGLEIADLREGERSIDQLWSLAYPNGPIPAEYDFRMA